MGGIVSSSKKEKAAVESPGQEKKKKKKRRLSQEEEFRIYQESLQNKSKEGAQKPDEEKAENEVGLVDQLKEGEEAVATADHQSKENESKPAESPFTHKAPLLPVKITNPSVFEEFSEEFKTYFIRENTICCANQTKEHDRYKRVDIIQINGTPSEATNQPEKFDTESYPWLKELRAKFLRVSEEEEEFYIVANSRSLSSIEEINKSHLSRCLALDLSSNRFTDNYFAKPLSRLLYLNLEGNLLVSLEGINCCPNLIGLNASHNLITSIGPLKLLLRLESLNLSSNKLCNLIDSNDEVKSDSLGENLSKLNLPPKLTYLNVSYNPKMSSMNGIEVLQHLTALDCSACSFDCLDLGLSQLKQLSTVSYRSNYIAKMGTVLRVVKSLPSLTSLDLSNNPFIEKDEKQGKGVYYLAMLELTKGRLKDLDNRKILEKDYRRYDSLKSEVQCEELVANLNVECSDKLHHMESILNNLSSRHRLEEEVLRGAIRHASGFEKKKYSEFTAYVNEKLRDLRAKEKISSATMEEIRDHIGKMKNTS